MDKLVVVVSLALMASGCRTSRSGPTCADALQKVSALQARALRELETLTRENADFVREGQVSIVVGAEDASMNALMLTEARPAERTKASALALDAALPSPEGEGVSKVLQQRGGMSFRIEPSDAGSTVRVVLPRTLADCDVLQTLAAHAAEIKSCRVRHANEGAKMSGTLTVHTKVRPDGSPSEIRTAPEQFDGTVLQRCVVDTVKTWKFPQFSGDPLPVDFPVRAP